MEIVFCKKVHRQVMNASENLIKITKTFSCRYSRDRIVFVMDGYLDGPVTKDITDFYQKMCKILAKTLRLYKEVRACCKQHLAFWQTKVRKVLSNFGEMAPKTQLDMDLKPDLRRDRFIGLLLVMKV